ncbi:non-ribosomal peptide synthetase, partial [Paenibacillus pinihumi]|uniref:non-ribosomal peptide synthetase n=1 Tax=Paenibacillus pinihumi TaxID=669462 RepID=UPI0012B53573
MFDRNQVEDIYELSPMQQGMLYHSIRDEGSQAYVEQMNFTLQGDVELGCLEKSFQMLFQRYSILRTVFIYENVDRPLQIVLKQREAKVAVQDISHIPSEQQQEYIRTVERQDREKGFDLTKDVLMRMILLKLNPNQYRLIWSHHHILLDGWCFSIIMEEFFQVYYALLTQTPVQLGPVYPYSQYMKWLKSQDIDEAMQFWQGYLEGFEQKTVLPQQKQLQAGKYEYTKGESIISLGREVTGALQAIAKSSQATLNHIVQAIWGIVFARYNNTNDVVYGSVVSGRSSEVEGIERMVGLFINTIPVRIQPDQDTTFAKLITDVKQKDIESQRYDYVSLAQIQGSSQLKQDLFDILYVFQNYPVVADKSQGEVGQDTGFSVQDTEAHEQTNYDFTLMVAPGEDIIMKITYNVRSYSEDFVRQLTGHFIHIANQAVLNPDLQLGKFELTTAEEKTRIIKVFNATQIAYPREKTVVELFEEQAERLSSQTAVVYGDERLTYGELNARANQLAHALRSQGVGKEMLVGVMAERSVELIVSLLGVLKAGGAYLPIDPAYPQERIAYMLADSGARWLLSRTGVLPDGSDAIQTLALNDPGLQKYPPTNGAVSGSPDDLIYVMYTSGSTGRPKGVMIEHRSVVRLVQNTNFMDFKEKHRILQTGSIVFDASTLEIWGALLNGGELYLIDHEQLLSPQGLRAAVERH